MDSTVLSGGARRTVAGLWFGLFAFAATSILFLRPDLRFSALFLYVLLPTVAGCIAGSLWGGAILDEKTTTNAGQSMLRGVGVAGGAFLAFAVLYSLGLPLVERGWGMKQVGGILVAVLTLGPFMGLPLVLISGVLGGITLYVLGRRVLPQRDGHAPDHSNI